MKCYNIQFMNKKMRTKSVKVGLGLSMVLLTGLNLQPLTANSAEYHGVSFSVQNAMLSGAVKDKSGNPIPGVTVKLLELNRKVLTDLNGKYEFKVASGNYTLVFEHLAFYTRTFNNISATSTSAPLVVVMEESETSLGEVVVTALGIKKEERSLGYAVSRVDGKDIAETAPGNWVNALSGKVPGLNISRSGAGPGGTVRITLRGQNSLDLDKGEPLLVVDGVPITSGIIGNGGTSYGASDDSPIDYGNGLSDINPEDIETVTVLRGPSAAALYGSRAGAGAILITTKTKTNVKDRMTVSFSTGLVIDDINRYPDFQMQYGDGGLGKSGYYSFGASPDGPATHSGSTYGPKFDGQEFYQYDPNTQTVGTVRTPWVAYPNFMKDAFRTGYTFNNTLALSGGNANNQVRFSYNDSRRDYILENTGNSHNRFSFSSNSKLNKFQINTRVNYYLKGSDNLPLSGYNSNTYMYAIMYAHPNIPFSWNKNYWRPGEDGKRQNNRLLTTIDNPYFMLYEQLNTLSNSRLFGNVQASYEFNKKLSLQVRTGIDQSESFRTNRRPFSTVKYAEGRYQEQNVKSLERNLDFLAKYTENLNKDLRLNINVGGNNMVQQSQNAYITAERLSYPDIYTLANSKDRAFTSANRFHKVVNSLYSTAQLEYKNAIYLDLSGRNDWSSALPKMNNSFFYGSVSASFILSDLFNLSAIQPLSYLKLRTAVSEVGNDTEPYQTAFYYSNTAFGGSYAAPNILPGLNLKPEEIINREVGLEARFFKNRLGIDLSYYNTNSRNQILQVPNDPSTGYTERVFNAGLINNRGWELGVNGTIIDRTKFTWKSTLTWSRNRGYVNDLAPGVESVILASGPRGFVEARVGGRVGDIFGTGYLRSPQGEIVFDGDGLPLIDTDNMKYLGNSSPDWKAGWRNQITYKNFSLGILLDGQYGGDVYSYSHSIMAGSGKLTNSLAGRDNGVIGKGVKVNADGSYSPNDIIADADRFYTQMYLRDNVEENTFDVSFLKVRELSLSYAVPVNKIFKTKAVRSINVGVYGRDLFVVTNYPMWDPEIATMNRNRIEPGFETGQFPSTRSIGFNLSFLF